MIRHIVLWNFSDFAEGHEKKENIEIVKEKLLRLKGIVPGLLRIELFDNVNATAASADLLLVTEFETLGDLKNYDSHPEHLKAREYIRKVITRRVTHDSEFEV